MDNNLTPSEQMQQWQKLWDAASVKMTDEEPRPLKSVPDTNCEVELLQERRKQGGKGLSNLEVYRLAQRVDEVFSKKETAEKAANSSNPVHVTTVGKDQELEPEPNFSDGVALRELHDLKIKFEELERSVHAAMVSDKSSEESKIQKQLESVKSRIEELSNQLNPPPTGERSN